jgi:ubiquinone/menaquinone biosynthesis C-methylase UbiE
MSAPGDPHDAMRERYARRASLPAGRYAPLNAEVQARVHERQRATRVLLARHGVVDLAGRDIVEVGCGSGANLLEWLQFGAEPQRLVGNELLADRLEAARQRLPSALRLHGGDASALPLADASFDIVHQSTVFSSILEDAQQQRLAEAMWRWLRPGGAVLWYDFTVDNPRNPDVRGVPLARVRQLFPQGRIDARRVTLAPPIARAVTRAHPALYTLFNTVPLLRTHVLAWIAKP